MKKIIENFIEKGNGLNIIDAPTGFGKTFSINDFISSYKGNKKIFFITNQIKNLNYDSLKDLFTKNNKLDEFNNRVILIDANFKSILSINDYDITQEEILNSKEYNELSKICKSYFKVDNELKDFLIDTIRNELEPKFRMFLKKYFSDQKILSSEKLTPDFDWVKKLYPILNIDNRNIFIMTTKKFVMPQVSIFGYSFYFYNSEYVKDSIIFFDEFDSVKKDILDALITLGTNYKIDIIALFNRVNLFLLNNKMPKNIMFPGKYYEGKENFTPEKRIDKHLDYSDKLINECNLSYSFKMNKSNDDRNFIFKDEKMISINNTGEKIKYEYNDKKQANVIFLDSKRELPDLEKMIYRVKNNIKYIISILGSVSKNYFETYNSNESNLYKITINDAIYTVLNQVNVGNEYISFLYNSIIKLYNFKKRDRQFGDETEPNQYDFYNDGLNIFELSDDVEHNEKTIIKNYAIEDTPERIVLQLAKNSCVIGVSATGTIETNISNFDLEELKKRLGNSFRTIEQDHLGKIVELYFERNKEYDEKNIVIEPKAILNTNELVNEYSFLNIKGTFLF